MDTIEKIQRYIKRTGVKYWVNTPYQMDLVEFVTLTHLAHENAFDAIRLAFNYGRAKWERSAKAAQQRGGGGGMTAEEPARVP